MQGVPTYVGLHVKLCDTESVVLRWLAISGFLQVESMSWAGFNVVLD